MQKKRDSRKCLWCGKQWCKYQGKIIIDDSEILGHFCDLSHFNLFVKWNKVLLLYQLKN
jgi:hypothetical protein